MQQLVRNNKGPGFVAAMVVAIFDGPISDRHHPRCPEEEIAANCRRSPIVLARERIDCWVGDALMDCGDEPIRRQYQTDEQFRWPRFVLSSKVFKYPVQVFRVNARQATSRIKYVVRLR